MKLQEFVSLNVGCGFAKKCLEDMQSQIELKESISNNGSLDEFKKCLRDIERFYYILYGYINAAYAYGHISYEEQNSLMDELMELGLERKALGNVPR